MAHIYQIVNKVNNKSYVGKTLMSIEKRWKIHVKDSRKTSENHRPLYRAMNKYGDSNFYIKIIEECSDIDNREVYWI